jgi:peptide deformylase
MTEVRSDARWVAGDAHEDIVTIGDPRLKQKSEQVRDVAAAGDLLDRMVGRLRALNGAGLAAPQIGELVAAVVVEVRKTDVFPDRPESPLIVMVNPEVVEASEETDEDWEGCFSVPGLMGIVPRHRRITVRFTSPDGARHEETYEGYLARVIQHEVDHLDAIEFVDRMTSMRTLTSVRNYLRFHHPQPA